MVKSKALCFIVKGLSSIIGCDQRQETIPLLNFCDGSAIVHLLVQFWDLLDYKKTF